MEIQNKLWTSISNMYREDFFDKLGIEYNKDKGGLLEGTGLWTNQGEELRFATMPHIGPRYGEATTKILFVGLDIGKDEVGSIQTFSDRCASLCSWPSNAHMFGTYMEALYFLRPAEWTVVMERCKDLTNQRALEYISKEYPSVSELGNYFALTNYYKFVTEGRNERSGGENRQDYDIAALTDEILQNEIEILKPDIIWFQGRRLSPEKYQKLADQGYIVYVAYHPSVRGRCIWGIRPSYIKHIIEDHRKGVYGKYVKK